MYRAPSLFYFENFKIKLSKITFHNIVQQQPQHYTGLCLVISTIVFGSRYDIIADVDMKPTFYG